MKKLIRIGSRLHKVYTIGELAKELPSKGADGKPVPRTTISLRKLEDRGILFPANFRLPSKTTKSGDVRLGERIYTQTLVDKLKPIFYNEIRQGAKITDATKDKIRAAFAEEMQLVNL